MTPRRAAVLDDLRRVDRRLRERVGVPKTLSPSRAEATPLVEIAEQILVEAIAPEAAEAFATAIADMVEAQVKSFPGNIFWDLEFPATRLLALARDTAAVGRTRLAVASGLIVAVQRGFGRESTIHFRYTHDFAYGFDWARWVKQDSGARSAFGPLAPEFLRHMQKRAAEIHELVQRNDAKYPKLPLGASRNPFGFAREPREEELLLRDLAERRLLPVEAWRLDAEPRWDLPFSELREERAKALGIWLARSP
jgi:hypothetical protein